MRTFLGELQLNYLLNDAWALLSFPSLKIILPIFYVCDPNKILDLRQTYKFITFQYLQSHDIPGIVMSNSILKFGFRDVSTNKSFLIFGDKKSITSEPTKPHIIIALIIVTESKNSISFR